MPAAAASSSFRHPIHDAARAGDMVQLIKVLDRSPDAIHDSHHQTQWTALMIASARGHVQAVQLLLDHGAVVDLVAKGYTALYLAAREGWTQVVAILLDRGADPRIKTNVGWSTLMMAANRGHLAIVKMLLRHEGVDVNDTSNGGRTALWLACRWGHVEVAAALLRGGADFTLATRDSEGYGVKTPKEVAMEHGYDDVVRLIEDAEKAYLLHKARAIQDDHIRRKRFPFLPPPPHLLRGGGGRAGLPPPTIEVTSDDDDDNDHGDHHHHHHHHHHQCGGHQQQHSSPRSSSPVKPVLAFVAQHLHEELFRELLDGFFVVGGGGGNGATAEKADT